MTTNGYTKILRLDNESPSYVRDGHEEESKSQHEAADKSPTIRCDFLIPQINLSLIAKRVELLTIYAQDIRAKVLANSTNLKLEFAIQNF